MRIIRKIAHGIIVLALLAAGFPMLKGDVNLDERVDLADAVLSVRSVAQSVENPAAFEKNIENAIISIATAAGLQKALKADSTRAGVKTFQDEAPAVLIAGFIPGVISATGALTAESPFLYKSVYLAPSTPPPHLS